MRLANLRVVFGIGLCSLLMNTAAFADDCPAGAPRHPPLTSLDHQSMVAAYTASFRGLYHRDPTGQPGSGVDDTGYWVSTSDHYGQFSDGVCRAGWSAYWEMRLGGASAADPGLGDQPARFQASQPTPVPVPPTPPLPSVDLSGVLQRLDLVEAHLTLIQADIDAGRAENQKFFGDARGFVKTWGPVLLKYVAPALGGVLAGIKIK